MAQKSILLMALLMISYTTQPALCDPAPPTTPESLLHATINFLCLKPSSRRSRHTHFSYRTDPTEDPEFFTEKKYHEELIHFIFTISSEAATTFVNRVSYLRDNIEAEELRTYPEFYFRLLFISQESFDIQLGIASKNKSKHSEAEDSPQNRWRKIFATLDHLELYFDFFRNTEAREQTFVTGRGAYSAEVDQFKKTLDNPNVPFHEFAMRTKKFRQKTQRFEKSVATKKKADFDRFQQKSRTLHKFKKLLARYKKEVINAAFEEFPPCLWASNATKRKRINGVISEINKQSSLLLAQERQRLNKLAATDAQVRHNSSTFLEGCFDNHDGEDAP